MEKGNNRVKCIGEEKKKNGRKAKKKKTQNAHQLVPIILLLHLDAEKLSIKKY